MDSLPARENADERSAGVPGAAAPSDGGIVYLVAAAGNPNFGDELIVRSWLAFFAQEHPGRELWVDCPNPGRAAILFRDIHPNVSFTDTLWQIVWAYPPEPDPERVIRLDEAYPQFAELLRNLGTPRQDAGILLLREASVVHFLGGGYLNDVWPRHFGLLAIAQVLKELGGTTLYGTGLGFLPVSDGQRDAVRDILTRFDYVESRDRSGAELLGIDQGLDDAFLGFAADLRQPGWKQLPDVMVNVQGDFLDSGSRERLLEFTRRFLAANTDGKDAEAGIVEAIPPDDNWLFESLHAEHPNLRFFPFAEVWERGFPARAGQKWLSSRYHTHLLAAAAGAEGHVIGIKPGYYDVKHQALLELGTGWEYSELTDLAELARPGVAGDPAFAGRVEEFAERKRRLAERLYPLGQGVSL